MRKKIIIIFLIIFFTISGYSLQKLYFSSGVQSILSNEFDLNKISSDKNCPSWYFNKSAIVFDSLIICWTNWVTKEKLEYAANVAAQWLDNNQDWIADNEIINAELKKQKAILLMSKQWFSNKSNKIFSSLEEGNYFWQDLQAIETNPIWERDASQEEIHHLIIGAGWAKVYPKLFNDKSKDSTIYKLWKYSDTKWYYNYLDPTCDVYCKTMEHLYKGIAAYLNSSADLADTEFTIKNNKDLRNKHKKLVELFESKKYNYPKIIWPDWNYKFKENVKYTYIEKLRE